MPGLSLHPEVHSGLRAIEMYRAQHAGAGAAEVFTGELLDFIVSIGILPGAGRSRNYAGVEVQTRTFRKRHVVVYVHEDGLVRVLEVHSTWMSEESIEQRIGQRR